MTQNPRTASNTATNPAKRGMKRSRIVHDGKVLRRARCQRPREKMIATMPNDSRSNRPRGPMLQNPGWYSAMEAAQLARTLEPSQNLGTAHRSDPGTDVLDRAKGARWEKTAIAPESRVGAIGATDRPMPMYAAGREPVAY